MNKLNHPAHNSFLRRTIAENRRMSTAILLAIRDNAPSADQPLRIVPWLALGRLIQSVRATDSLLLRRYTFEAIAVMRQMFEQLAWIHTIHTSDDDYAFRLPPTKCIKRFNVAFPIAGRFYGFLSEVGHMHPKFIRDYVGIDEGETDMFIYARPGSAADAAQYALALQLLLGLYGAVSELFVGLPESKRKYFSMNADSMGLTDVFWKRFVSRQTRLQKLNRYVSNPPNLKLAFSRH